jgi:hypothetical protein
MTDKDLHLGMVVCGKNNITIETGRIKKIQPSTGSRKGLIYNVGINWFFADEIYVDWFCILEMIGERNTYELKTPFKFTCGGKKVVATPANSDLPPVNSSPPSNISRKTT